MSQPPSARNSVIDLLRAACVLYIVGFWHLMTYTEAFPGYHNGVTTRLTVAVLAKSTSVVVAALIAIAMVFGIGVRRWRQWLPRWSPVEVRHMY